MLGLILAAALMLGPRPPDLVGNGEESRYAAWLEGEARRTAGEFARADCSGAMLAPLTFGPTRDEALAKLRPGVMFYAESLSVQGCGPAQAQGLVVWREQDGWKAIPMAPGGSKAGLALQREVLRSVILAVKAAADSDTSCTPLEKAQSALIYDTRVTRTAAEDEPWSERWYMSVCAAKYQVDIDFTPIGEGAATYDVHMALPEPPRAKATGSPGEDGE